jgi:hypothetical protein
MEHKIVGLFPRSWKMPIVASKDGKTYKFSSELVVKKLYPETTKQSFYFPRNRKIATPYGNGCVVG